MPGVARQFEPQITRIGGAPSKYRFTARCSTCPKSDSYEANQPVSDDVVKGYFKDRGWLLGRDRSYDLCPTCLAGPRDAAQRREPEAPRRGIGTTGRQFGREPAPMRARHKDTADILDRHLGKPEALAAEVFRPREADPVRSAAPQPVRQPVPSPALPPEVQQFLNGMAADLKSLRSTMELMAEQMSKLVSLGGQQIEAIARLAPLMIQSSDGISGRLQELTSVVRSIPQTSDDVSPQQPPSGIDPDLGRNPDTGSEAEPIQAAETVVAQAVRQPRKKRAGATRTAADTPIVVKSIPDAKRPDRFYTTIRVPRELWDSSGFVPADRLQIDWSGKALSIRRVGEGGVKPKSFSDSAVILQSWRLGNLNLDQPKAAGAKGVLRLTMSR